MSPGMSEMERQRVQQDISVHDDFVSESEQKAFFNELHTYLKRLRYEFDHWDNAIQGYRETERRQWSPENERVLQRIRELAFPSDLQQLPLVHVLDLAKDGFVKPHVDSVRFCGGIIAGLNLLSPCVMRFSHESTPQNWVKALIKPRSLYIMRGRLRYDYMHEVLRDSDSYFRGKRVPRDRRIAVICRCLPNNTDSARGSTRIHDMTDVTGL